MVDLDGMKDTFYAALRDRVAAGNAGRTVVVRGVVRPGVVAIENELSGAAVDGIAPVECFCMRWTAVKIDVGLVRLGCEIRYATDGSVSAGGMDRGRALAAMDEELLAAVNATPQNAAIVDVSESADGVAVETATGVRVFWSDVALGTAVMRGERMERTATVEVFGYE